MAFAVIVALSIGLVVLFVVGHQICQREAIMRRYKIDAVPGFPPTFLHQCPKAIWPDLSRLLLQN